MSEAASSEYEYVTVRRLIAAITLANDELTEEERLVIASSVGGKAHLSPEAMHLLIQDAKRGVDVKEVAASLRNITSVRQLFADLAALAVYKLEWHKDEIMTAKLAIYSLPIPEEVKKVVGEVFDGQIAVGKALATVKIS